MIWKIGLVCGLVSLAVCLPAGWLGSPDRWVGGGLAGWGLAVVNGSVGLVLMKHCVGGDMRRFMRVGVVGNSLRFLALLATLILVRWQLPADFAGMALATVAGSLVFIGGEIRGLYAGWQS